jgi:hypothetical protein
MTRSIDATKGSTICTEDVFLVKRPATSDNALGKRSKDLEHSRGEIQASEGAARALLYLISASLLSVRCNGRTWSVIWAVVVWPLAVIVIVSKQ